MKRLFTLLCAVITFAACEQAPVEEIQGVAASDRSLEVSFEGDDTRIQLNEAQKTVWTEGDHVSVFYRSAINEEWQFMGKTGDRTGQIVPVDNSVNPPATHNHVVVAYPYNADYFYNTEIHNIEASLPAVQDYLKDSYGTNGNIMISSGEFNQVSLKSVCGWLKLQLMGDGETVKSITLRGNNGEQVAGLLYVDSAAATATLASAMGDAGDGEVGGTLVRPGTILTEVTLDCGEGVTLGAEATAFYIALPPQTFEQGFTVDVNCWGYYPMSISTQNVVTIERNHIQPMSEVEFSSEVRTIANNEIWYTSSDGCIIEPHNEDKLAGFNGQIISNTYSNGWGIIVFDVDVTSIGYNAFKGCSNLKSIIIPESVRSIGDYGGYTFAYCDKLEAFYGKFASDDHKCLIIGSHLESFAPAGVVKYTIPDGIYSIGEAFRGCANIENITIPSSVEYIDSYAFADCCSLKSIIIPNNVSFICDCLFWGCTNLTSVTIPNDVISIGDFAFAFCNSLTSVTIPDSVTTIGDYAFYECTSLTSVYCKATTPPALGGTYVFDNNGSGRKIYVPAGSVNAYKSAEYWSEYADAIVGYDFENGEIVEVQPNNEIWYTSLDGDVITPYDTDVFGTTITSNTYSDGKGVITFDSDVTRIGDWAFRNCNITSIAIPNSVTRISEKAFYNCYSLTSITIPDSVISIGEEAFNSCDELSNVIIGDSVTTIDFMAFSYCTNLTSITIGDSVTSIGNYAFAYCTKQRYVFSKSTTPPLLSYNSFENTNIETIYVPTEAIDAYKTASYWRNYTIVGYDFENGVVVE